jgi:hypothetical protein
VNSNDIVILGDSFCEHRAEDWTWPGRLMSLLTGEFSIPRGAGFGGAAWWSTRQRLLQEMKDPPKVLILCHTQQDRIHSDKNLGLNSGVALGSLPVKGSDDPEVTKAVKYYYRYLHSYEYHEWAMLAWFKELDSIVKDIPVVIHLPGFKFTNTEHKFETGVTVYPCLNDLVDSNASESIRNHFTREQNLDLANMLYNIINNYKPGIIQHHEFQLLL